QPGAAGDEAQDESDADASADAQAAAREPEDRSTLPNQELTEKLLYEFLLAEIAVQRGNAALSAQAYVDLAKRTRDPRIAARHRSCALRANEQRRDRNRDDLARGRARLGTPATGARRLAGRR